MKNSAQIIRRPIITERASMLQEEQDKYLFEVRRNANKIEIKQAVESMFDVDVTKVNTIRMRGKIKRLGRFQGRRPDWKKAVVTLAKGQSIDFFEGI
ncbi:MAG: 50S ribosomal protein L23 [bacterium]|nr:50S ribosomal protein L23 [bacterium]